MLRKIYALQLSYDVSSEEKQQAEKALLCFDHAMKLLNISTDHLDIMGTPFKDHPDIKEQDRVQYRVSLRLFRDKVIENFNNFKEQGAFKCIDAMQIFLSDTQVMKLVKLFDTSIEEIENQVNDFSKLFDNLESKTFIQEMNKIISNIQETCDELRDIVKARIEDHIKNNIIGKNWINGVSDKLQKSVERKTPITIDLFKRRQEQLHNVKQNKS